MTDPFFSVKGVADEKEPSVISGLGRLIFDLLKREGLDVITLFRQFDLDESQLLNPGAYCSQDSLTLA